MLTLDRVTMTLGTFALTAQAAVPTGGITALMGASGSGKSTLLAAIAGFLPVASGRILVEDTDITALPPVTGPCRSCSRTRTSFRI